MSAKRTAAAMALLGFVVVMPVLPAAVAAGVAGSALRPVAASLGGLVVFVCGLKLAAAAWGLVARVLDRARLGAVPAFID